MLLPLHTIPVAREQSTIEDDGQDPRYKRHKLQDIVRPELKIVVPSIQGFDPANGIGNRCPSLKTQSSVEVPVSLGYRGGESLKLEKSN